jgi:hypothetical protein
MINILAYRPLAERQLCKQRPFLGNGSVNSFPLLGSRFLIMQQLDYNNGNGVFLRVPLRDVYKQGTKSIVREFCTGVREERTWGSELKNLHC